MNVCVRLLSALFNVLVLHISPDLRNIPLFHHFLWTMMIPWTWFLRTRSYVVFREGSEGRKTD